MKVIAFFKERSKALLYAVARFPAVVALLMAFAVVMTVEIAAQESYPRLTMALAVTVLLALFAHVLLEKENDSWLHRLLPIPIAGAGFVLYYFLGLIGFEPDNLYYGAGRYPLQTVVVCVIFFLLFLAVQSLRHSVVFGSVFMSFFKAFFTTLLFSAVIWGGLMLITVAIDELLFDLNEKIFSYISVWVWLLVAPIIFMSLLLTFRSDEEGQAADKKRMSCPAFFRALLLYVVIPLLAVYTLVLIIYLIKTIVSEEGQELLEPLILSYTIAVIMVYFLVSEIEGKYPAFYRFLFPKIMGVIALYQLIVSLTKAGQQGVMFSDYFLILFSAFAVVAAVTMSILSTQKSHIHILILTAFALFSILPLVNFYGVSVRSQQQVLVETLEKNGMLQGKDLIASETVSNENRIIITRSVDFLNRQGELDEIVNVPGQENLFEKFRTLFGFDPAYANYYQYTEPEMLYFDIDRTQAIPVEDADFIISGGFFAEGKEGTGEGIYSFTHAGIEYTVKPVFSKGEYNIVLYGEGGQTLIIAPISKDMARLKPAEGDNKTGVRTPDEMRFDYSNGDISMTIYLMSARFFNEGSDAVQSEFEPLILIRFTDPAAE